MNKDYIYKRRLLKLADYLDTLPPKRFDYSIWSSSDDTVKNSCGSVACAFGHASSIPSFRKLGLILGKDECGYTEPIIYGMKLKHEFDSKSEQAAAIIFGFNRDEFEYVFLPSNNRNGDDYQEVNLDNKYGNGPNEDATAKQVAKHIRRFVSKRYS